MCDNDYVNGVEFLLRKEIAGCLESVSIAYVSTGNLSYNDSIGLRLSYIWYPPCRDNSERALRLQSILRCSDKLKGL